ncbi:MAG: hypothetical protein AB7O38_28090, partial [Pirellulaceae bacterium]
LKKRLAEQYPEDIDAYTEGKTQLILRILREAGVRADEREAIEQINRRTVQPPNGADAPVDSCHHVAAARGSFGVVRLLIHRYAG